MSTILSLAMVHSNPRNIYFRSTHPILNYSYSPVLCQMEHLVLNRCDYTGCLVILNNLSHLRTFMITKCTMEEYEAAMPFSNSSLISPLKSLTIDDCCLTTASLASLLIATPSLAYIKLASRRATLDHAFDGCYWAKLSQTKLLSLIKFSFFFSCELGQDCDLADVHLRITTFQTEFWIDKKCWFMSCAYIISSNTVWFYTSEDNVTTGHESSPKWVTTTMNSTWRFTLTVYHKTTKTDLCDMFLHPRQMGIIVSLKKGRSLFCISPRTLNTLKLQYERINDLGTQFICHTLKNNSITWLFSSICLLLHLSTQLGIDDINTCHKRNAKTVIATTHGDLKK